MNKTILITGATDGIGLALAQQYDQLGAHLIMVGRRPLRSPGMPSLCTADTYCQADLGEPDFPRQIITFLKQQQIKRLDLVIHNAGLGYVGALDKQPAHSAEQILRVNSLAPIALTHALANEWLAEAAHLVFVSSVVVSWPAANYAVYAASKAALDGFVRSLQVEWADRPHTIQLIHPGATRTGMHAKSGLDKAQVNWDRFPPAVQVAAAIRRRISRPKRQAAIGFSNSLIYQAGRWLQPLVDRLQRQAKVRPTGLKRALVTGAGAGIGRALSLKYSAAGYEVIGIEIDEEAGLATREAIVASGGRCQMVTADLSQRQQVAALPELLRALGPFSVVVHNAGISAFGQFEALSWHQQEQVLVLNLFAPILLSLGMLQNGTWERAGSLVYLASLSHYVGYPGAAAYAASKDGLTHFGRSLRAAGKRATVVFPGPTRTDHARRYSPDNSREDQRMLPETVADAIFKAEQRGSHRLIPGGVNKLLALGGRLLPTVMENVMRRALYEKIHHV